MVFEPTVPVFEWWRAAYALYPVATVVGTLMTCTSYFRRGRKIANVRPHGTALLPLDGIL